MSAAKVTPIRVEPTANLSPPIIRQIEAARTVIFNAGAIAAVAAAAATGEAPADEHSTARVLRIASDLCDKAADMLDSVTLEKIAAAEVNRG